MTDETKPMSLWAVFWCFIGLHRWITQPTTMNQFSRARTLFGFEPSHVCHWPYDRQCVRCGIFDDRYERRLRAAEDRKQ